MANYTVSNCMEYDHYWKSDSHSASPVIHPLTFMEIEDSLPWSQDLAMVTILSQTAV